MGKVLVVRKPDRTIHVVPLANKAVIMNYNIRRPLAERWKLEEMDEEAARKLPFIDDSYITAAEAQNKVKELEAETTQKDNRIAELERMLAEKQQTSQDTGDSTNIAGAAKKPEPAISIIEKVKTATIDEAKALLDGETRVTVLEAINNRISELDQK